MTLPTDPAEVERVLRERHPEFFATATEDEAREFVLVMASLALGLNDAVAGD